MGKWFGTMVKVIWRTKKCFKIYIQNHSECNSPGGLKNQETWWSRHWKWRGGGALSCSCSSASPWEEFDQEGKIFVREKNAHKIVVLMFWKYLSPWSWPARGWVERFADLWPLWQVNLQEACLLVTKRCQHSKCQNHLHQSPNLQVLLCGLISHLIVI